ncbi:MAG: HNH endonuclease, partial [Clostridia bacterium]|nr:HNH endonuclease [Clostridia bacterium]
MVIYDRNTKKCTQYQLHRFLMNPTSREEVDHINHNTLDNRKSNLRIVTTAQNQMNSVVSDRNRSG